MAGNDAAKSPRTPEKKYHTIEELVARAREAGTGGELPAGCRYVKVDFTTLDEEGWGSLLGCSSLLLFVFMGKAIEKSSNSGLNPIFTFLAILTFMGVGYSFFRYRNLNEYYVLDLEKKTVFFAHHEYDEHALKPVGTPETIAGIGVQGRRHTSKSREWVEYRVTLFIRAGRPVHLGNENRDLEPENEKAFLMARLLGCPYFEGRTDQSLQVVTGPNGWVAEYKRELKNP